MNRLATISQPPRAGLWIVLDHLEDAHPDEHATAIAHLANPDVSATELAEVLTMIARQDNVHATVTEQSIRRHRKAHR